jgi:hypothetical protein
MRICKLITLTAALLSIGMAGTVLGLNKAEVVERLVTTYGGQQNLAKLNSTQQLWKIHVLATGSEGQDYRKVLLPDHLSVDLTYPNRTESRSLSGNSAFRSYNRSELKPANSVQADAQRLQLMRLYTPLILQRKLGQLEFTDDRLFCMLSLKDSSIRVDYLVNKETWRIEKVAGTMSMGKGKMEFLTEYSDFRMVDGVLMHHKENKYAGNVNTARLELLKIEFDSNLDPGDFHSSSGAEAFMAP